MRIKSLNFANILSRVNYTDTVFGIIFAHINLFSLAWASMGCAVHVGISGCRLCSPGSASLPWNASSLQPV